MGNLKSMLSDSLYGSTEAKLVDCHLGRAEYRRCPGLAMWLSTDNSFRCGVMLILAMMLLVSGCSSAAKYRATPSGSSADTGANHNTGSNQQSEFNRLLHESNGNIDNFNNHAEPGKTRRVARDFALGLNQLGRASARQSRWWRDRTLRLPFPENDFDIELLRVLQQAEFRILESNQNRAAHSLEYSVTRLASRASASQRQAEQYRFEIVVENEYALSRDYLTDQNRAYPLGPMRLRNLSTGSVQVLSIDNLSLEETATGFGTNR